MANPDLPVSHHLSRKLVAVVVGCSAVLVSGLVVWSGRAQSPPSFEYAREPPEKIVTAEACGECHLAEIGVWKRSSHATGFRTLHRKESAEAIASKMGFRLMKRDSLCLRCHYTPTARDGQLRAVSGVSCESCHGAGRDWIDLHNDYGKGFDHESEPADHRRSRIEASRRAGMRRPSDLYAVATSCFGCHTVPEEKLVNVGGHSTGSVGFELVERSQGSIRHNYLAATRGEEGATNRQRSPAQKRPLYVVGRTVALEFSLRAVAAATTNGAYSRAVSRRYQMALREVQKVDRKVSIPQIRKILAVAAKVRAVPNNGAALRAAADEIGAATRSFLDHSGSFQLAALDNLVQSLDEPEPEEAVAQSAEGGLRNNTGGDGGGAGEPATPGATVAAVGTGAPTPGATARRAGRPAAGTFKRRIHPRSKFRTLGPGACGGCHEGANAWWARDAHFTAAQPFFDRRAKNVKIALLYGIKVGSMTKGNQLCMDCHGTIVSGSEGFDVFDGVGCESCHGPAKDFLQVHKEGDKALGSRRGGYVQALKLGMVELKNVDTRAKTCTGCHFITDPRLISSGHPSGKGFDYAAGLAKIDHWEQAPASGQPFAAAVRAALAARGPVPQVELAELAPAAEATLAQERQRSPSLAAATGASWNRQRPAGGSRSAASGARAPGQRNLAPPIAVSHGPVELPPFPQVEESATIEDLLLLVQQRLELLYRAVNPPSGGGS